MVKFYETEEEGYQAINKYIKTILNAFNKNKYSNISKFVSKTDQGFKINGTFEYPHYHLLVNGEKPEEIQLLLDHWTEPVPLTAMNIGSLRGVAGFLIEFKKEMSYNFE